MRLAESTILLAVVFDQYVAICDPLRYMAVSTHLTIVKTGLAALVRSFCIIFPCIFLLKQLPYCGRNAIPHTYCKHIDVDTGQPGDTPVNILCGLAVPFVSIILDVVFVVLS